MLRSHARNGNEFQTPGHRWLPAKHWDAWFWNSFTFLAWDLSMHPRTQIWFCNQFICTRACACSSNLNYAHKCIENSVNALKCPNEPWKIKKIDRTLLLFYVDTRKILEAIRGNGYSFIPKGGTFPTQTIMLVVRSSSLWEAYTQTYPKWDKKLPRHVDAAPW